MLSVNRHRRRGRGVGSSCSTFRRLRLLLLLLALYMGVMFLHYSSLLSATTPSNVPWLVHWKRRLWRHLKGMGKSAVICAVQKHETAYLNEWVDYHLALGFDGLYLYDNAQDFELRSWKEKHFDADDRIQTIHFPGDKIQIPAYKACAKQVQENGHTWALFIDIDEFLVLKKHEHVMDFALEHGTKGTVGINWQVFGTAGRHVYEPLPVTYRFQCRLPDKYNSNIYIKSFVKVSDIVPERIFDPHFFPLKGNKRLYTTEGTAFNASRIWGPRDTAVINHYYFRSHEEHLQKRTRGDVFFGGKIHVKEAKHGLDPHTKQAAPNGVIRDSTAWLALTRFYPERYASYEFLPQKEESQCSQLIPHILHFVYVSPGVPNQPNEIPASINATIEEWKDLHKGWTIEVWDNLAVHKQFPTLVTTLQKIKTMLWVANLIRYHVLEEFGGIYLDTDIVPLQSLEPLRNRPAFTVCQNPFQKTSDFSWSNLIIPHEACELACNAVIGAIPHHPALEETVQNSMENTHDSLKNRPNDKYSLSISGPYQWTKDLKKFSDVTILRSFTFYPCVWTNKEECVREKYASSDLVFAMHTWTGSWLKD